MKKYDVVCVGFAVQDIVMQGIPEDALKQDSVHARKTMVASGGDAVNQACVLARLGKKVTLVAGFGHDPVGVQVASDLKNNGVDIEYAVRDGITKTGFSVVLIKMMVKEVFWWIRRGNVDISVDQVPLELLEQTKAVSIGSLFFMKKLDGAGAAELFKRARAKGVLTFADMTADAYGIGPDGIAEIYPYTDYMMPSYEEAVYVTGENEPKNRGLFSGTWSGNLRDKNGR